VYYGLWNLFLRYPPEKSQKRSRENISERYFTHRTIKAGKNQKYNTSGNITGKSAVEKMTYKKNLYPIDTNGRIPTGFWHSSVC
jgi:hypothetical protein